MKQYVVPMNLIYQNQALTGRPAIRGNILSLWNKNRTRWSKWRVLGKSEKKHSLVVERGTCPRYWAEVVHNAEVA